MSLAFIICPAATIVAYLLYNESFTEESSGMLSLTTFILLANIATKTIRNLVTYSIGLKSYRGRYTKLIQTEPSKIDTIGKVTSVCYEKISFIQGLLLFYKIINLTHGKNIDGYN